MSSGRGRRYGGCVRAQVTLEHQQSTSGTQPGGCPGRRGRNTGCWKHSSTPHVAWWPPLGQHRATRFTRCVSRNSLSTRPAIPSVLTGKPRQSVFKQLPMAGAAWFKVHTVKPAGGTGGLALPGKPGWWPPERGSTSCFLSSIVRPPHLSLPQLPAPHLPTLLRW